MYAPLIMKKMLKMNVSGILFTIIKQFGTGVIIATGFVHVRPRGRPFTHQN